jgi:hypothetical protein
MHPPSTVEYSAALRRYGRHDVVDGMGASEAEGLVLQNDSWVAGVGEHSRW